MNEKQLKKFLEMQKAMEGGAVQPAELKQVIEVVLGVIKELKSLLQNQISTGDSKVIEYCEAMMPDMKGFEKKLGGISNQIKDISSKEVAKAIKATKDMIEDIRRDIPSMPDLTFLEAKIEQIKASIPVIKDTILDTPIQIREKVQSLPEGKRWEIEDVNDLRKELETLRNEVRSIPRGGGGRALMPRTGGVAFEKLNSRLDGVTKTFNIPNLRDVIAIMGTSFPTTFASTDDYTVGNKSITFTSAIDAATTLSAGQTIIVVYNQLHYT